MAIKRLYDTLVGATVNVNQLVNSANISETTTVNGITFTNNGDGSVTVSGTASAVTYFNIINAKAWPAHKYLLRGCPSTDNLKTYNLQIRGQASPVIDTGNGVLLDASTYSYKGAQICVNKDAAISTPITFKPEFIDLTQMLGTSIADYVYSMETATAGSGIAWLRSYGFLKGYQAYNAGLIESVEVTGKKVVGFNQWDEEYRNGTWTTDGAFTVDNTRIASKNMIPVLPNTTYYFKLNDYSSWLHTIYYDASGNIVGNANPNANTTFITPSDAHYMRFNSSGAWGTRTYNHDICINLSSDRNGEYEPYSAHTYDLGTDTLRGIFKLDANNQLYADGDRKEADGTITRKYGVVDLGTLNWGYISTEGHKRFTATLTTASRSITNLERANIISSRYMADTFTNVFNNVTDKTISITSNGLQTAICDEAYTDTTAFKTAMDGVMLVYELATPTAEQSTPFTSPQVCYPDGTEEYVTSNGVPVGHETRYQL